ncbi:MAG: hypothetical protein JRI23_29775 [Deltaproteobacteria bacterium]|jgi:hypothetical protein|nr:hypothetical protein [Deltaproteobacteria bacterium]MBW2536340.1 hypothetical protein [Deltaproteobacteria bacterium]
MNRRTTALSALTLLVAATAVGCAADDDIGAEESYMQESTAPISGAEIPSPSVDPNKMYWGGRNISHLEQLGYLEPVAEQLARRADGIIGLLQPNGAIGAKELAKLETEYFDTLFPEEQAAIPKLWAILQIDDAQEFSPSDSVSVTVVDDYTVTPFSLPIDDLAAEYQSIARRIQLTLNLDGDADAINGSELASAYEDREAYLPSEVQLFKYIAAAIAEAAPYNESSVQRVEVTPTPGAAVLDVPSIKISCTTKVGQSSWSARSPSNLPILQFSYALSTVGVDADVRVLSLNKATGSPAFLSAGTALGSNSTYRIEVWKNGARIEQYDVIAPPPETYADPIPFAYDLKIDQDHKVMNFRMPNSYTYEPIGQYGEYSPANLSAPLSVPPGSYAVFGKADMRLDVFDTGRINVVEQGFVEPCKPTRLRDSTHIRDCKSASGTALVFFEQHVAQDSPDFGIVTIGSETFPLYPL